MTDRIWIVLLSLVVISQCFEEVIDNQIPLDDIVDQNSEDQKEIIKNIEEDENIEEYERGFEALNLENAFKESVEAYLENKFDKCIVGFNHVIKRYKKYRSAVIKCRSDCQAESSDFVPIIQENIEDLHFYDKKLQETLCLLKCHQNYRKIAGLEVLKRLPEEIELKLITQAPYEYLHICYYQKNHFQDAANAAFTYLVYHPNHEMSRKNLLYYISLPDVDNGKIVNLEAEDYVQYYRKGLKAYDNENYPEVIYNMEKSMRAYLKAENECRIYCEGPFNQGWLPEFTASIANHFTYCLKCKRGCSRYLNNLNGKYEKDLLASHYNYLQFAYYQMGDIKKTCEAVESYLSFDPADETMNSNKQYYSNLPKTQPNYFTPRSEAIYYIKRQEYELRILKFIADEFAPIDSKLNESIKPTEKKNNLDDIDGINEELKVDFNRSGNSKMERYKKPIPREFQTLIDPKLKVILKEEQLGGKLRYLAEGLITEFECNCLMKLAEIGGIEGDGYENNESPHSKYELFHGLTVGRAALMTYFGLLEPDQLELFLKVSEKARKHVENYFNLNRKLYFTFTHLVCRSALPESPKDEETLSHLIHSDNCLITKDGCLQEEPAFTWRDYSAIVYLNNNFEGGEFIFANDTEAKYIQSTIKPSCGKLVGFSADENNLHGVKGVKTGRRCALALWFTLNEKYIEIERNLADIILKRVRLIGTISLENVVIPLDYEKMLRKQFRDDSTLNLLLAIS